MVLLALEQLTDVIDATLLLFTRELTDKFRVAEKLTFEYSLWSTYRQVFSKSRKHISTNKWNSLRCATMHSDEYVWDR